MSAAQSFKGALIGVGIGIVVALVGFGLGILFGFLFL
jgi:hypothetical protein